jgi:hypothetical protein
MQVQLFMRGGGTILEDIPDYYNFTVVINWGDRRFVRQSLPEPGKPTPYREEFSYTITAPMSVPEGDS